MGKRSVRRPTEDIAIARVTAQKGKGTQGDPALLQKTIMDKDGTKYLIWCFHNQLSVSIADLWDQDWDGTFVDFLMYRGIIYRYQRM